MHFLLLVYLVSSAVIFTLSLGTDVLDQRYCEQHQLRYPWMEPERITIPRVLVHLFLSFIPVLNMCTLGMLAYYWADARLLQRLSPFPENRR